MVTHRLIAVLCGHVLVHVRSWSNNYEKENTVVRYNELLKRKLEETKTDPLTFFRICHIDCFGTDPNLTEDVILYREQAVVPVYVIRFLKENPQ
jgi:hypothetical protein